MSYALFCVVYAYKPLTLIYAFFLESHIFEPTSYFLARSSCQRTMGDMGIVIIFKYNMFE